MDTDRNEDMSPKTVPMDIHPVEGSVFMVSRLLELEIQSAESDLGAACEKANSLKLDTQDWENLNESETW